MVVTEILLVRLKQNNHTNDFRRHLVRLLTFLYYLCFPLDNYLRTLISNTVKKWQSLRHQSLCGQLAHLSDISHQELCLIL